MTDCHPSSAVKPPPEAIDWPRLAQLLRDHRRFLVTTHVRPDGDALGSVLGMSAILEHLGKEVIVAVGYDIPASLQFLDPQHKIKRLGKEVSPAELQSIDAMLILDTCAWAQLGHIEQVIRSTAAKKIVLDHHVSCDDLGAEVFKDSEADATGSLVLKTADHLGAPLGAPLAELLFVAIATDTGWFRFASATAQTYRTAARLITAGAKPHEIYANLYEHDRLARLHLLGRVMARAETDLDGRLIWTSIQRSDFEATGAASSDTEDMINMLLVVGGTEVAAIFVETSSGGVKLSLRSRCKVDCARLAAQFGGGGHKAAAGATLHEPLSAACARVLDAVRAELG